MKLAHLRHHHAAYVLLAQLAAAANPLLRPLAGHVRLAVELWADREAASEVGDGRLVARALARASLAAAGESRLRRVAPPAVAPPAALPPAEAPSAVLPPAVAPPTVLLSAVAPSAAATHVRARVTALTGRPPRRRRWVAAALVMLTLASGAAAAALAWDTHQQIEIAQLAYTRAHHRTAQPGSRLIVEG
jgi:hypothetical protein